ncbi:unnamed protein product [Lactuca virosa]|uniref:Uncharacterized protein n=1 Tax=Lactuca virosa TaxID=75947 RepID=A0AAU9NDJ0_9ASTR|nr:unnamed protein product [Lactuca virosa]
MFATVYMMAYEELRFHSYKFSSEFSVKIFWNNRLCIFILLNLMFAFKALLDAKVKRNRVSSHTKFKKKYKMASEKMVFRKNDCENDYVDKVDFMVNYVDHPIEIDDDEVSEEEEEF